MQVASGASWDIVLWAAPARRKRSMRYLGLLGLLIAVAIMLYLSAPKAERVTQTPAYRVATGAAQRAAGAAGQHVRDVMNPLNGTQP
jgi:hypothetical protein